MNEELMARLALDSILGGNGNNESNEDEVFCTSIKEAIICFKPHMYPNGARYRRELVDFISIDVSFISLTKILPPVRACLKDGGQVVCLIKPQFEAGREKVGKKGVVRDRQVHEDVIKQIMDFASALGFSLLHLDYSPIKGPEGNIEYLLHLLNRPEESQINDEMIPDVVTASHQSLSHREAAK